MYHQQVLHAKIRTNIFQVVATLFVQYNSTMLVMLLSCQTADTLVEKPVEDSAVDSIDEETVSQRYVLTTMLYRNKSGQLFVYDRQTYQVIWQLDNPNDVVWQDARVTNQGQNIVHNECDVVDHDFSKAFFVTIDTDGNELQRIAAPATHHSVDIIDESTLVSIEYDVRDTTDYLQVAGDSVVLFKNGQRELLLSTFDVLNPSPITEMWEHGFFPNAYDWTHANSIRWYPEHESLLLTIPGLNSIWRIGLDGMLQEVYLGRFATSEPYEQGNMYQQQPYPIIEGGTFDMPHGATLDSMGRLWVLSNGLGTETESTAQGYEIIEEQLSLFQEIDVPIEGARTAGLGSVEYLEDTEGVLINWGILGILEEVDSNNQRIWQLETSLGEVLGMSTTFDDFSQ
jgi:hypothetical protein